MSERAPRAGDLTDVEASGHEVGRHRCPPLGRPSLAYSVSLGHEQYGVAKLGSRMGVEGNRSRKIGGDAEVGADALEDLVDVERSELFLERRRSPPEVPLDRMVPEIHQPIAVVGDERGLIDASRQADDAGSEPALCG